MPFSRTTAPDTGLIAEEPAERFTILLNVDRAANSADPAVDCGRDRPRYYGSCDVNL